MRRRLYSAAASLLLVLCLSGAAIGQPGNDAVVAGASAAPPAEGALEARKQEVEASKVLSDADKTSLLELYERTERQLEAAADWNAQAQDYADALMSAPAEIADLTEAAGESHAAPELGDLAPEAIAPRLSDLATQEAQLVARIGELDKQLDAALGRPSAARGRIAELRESVSRIDAALQGVTSTDQSAELVQARRWALASERLAQLAEIEAIERELASLEVRQDLYRTRRDAAEAELARVRSQTAELQARQAQVRRQEAERAEAEAERAKREAVGKHPLIQSLTTSNAEISKSLAAYTADDAETRKEVAAIRQEKERLEEDFRSARARVEAAGFDRALGQVLADNRAELPDLRTLRKGIEARDDAIAQATLDQIRAREERRRLADVDAEIARLAAGESLPSEVRDTVAELLRQRREMLARALTILQAHILAISESNQAAYALIDTAERFSEFLDQHLLWVRNVAPVGLDTLATAKQGLARILSPQGWWEVVESLTRQLPRHPVAWLGLAVVVFLLLRTSALRRAIRATAEPLRRIRTDSFRFSLDALVLSLVAALPMSLLLWTLGSVLTTDLDATPFTQAIGKSLTELALGLYLLRAFRLLVLSGGLADRHFRWSSESLSVLRANLRWLTYGVVPLAFIAWVLFFFNDPGYSAGLGRLVLVAVIVGIGLFLARVLNPHTGAFREALAAHPDRWPNRLRNLWYPLILGIPAVLVVLTLLGYQYTAGTLFESLVASAWLALALLVTQQMIVRWLIVTRRKLALQAALERQAARRAQGDKPASGTAGEIQQAVTADEQDVDLATLDEQTRRLVNALVGFAGALGLWLLWADMVPAFTFLDRFALWHYKGVVEGVEQLVPVTVADMALVVLIVFAAVVAARNLPGLIEILLLQLTALSAGSRYTIKTLASYTISAAAFLTAFSTLGLSWNQVQWLVAALGVGIGFGLQEIVANFISGLIILFERPVRVGDVVTIGDTTGVVTNIQIRATTIRNWDKQELLVPNKEFITGRLLNWSLTDPLNRLTVPVGIAYGSDTERALELLREVAAANPRVLADPEPTASVEGFGDNSVNLALRCHLDSLDYRIAVTTELHLAIERAFTRNGIEISFPQRDIHLRSAAPLDLRLHPVRRGEPRPAAGDSPPPV